MLNQSAELLLCATITVFPMLLLGLGVVYLAKLGKGKLSVLVFVVLVILSAVGLMIYPNLQTTEGIQYLGVHLSLLLIVAGFALAQNARLKHVGAGTASVGAGMAAWVVVSVFFR